MRVGIGTGIGIYTQQPLGSPQHPVRLKPPRPGLQYGRLRVEHLQFSTPTAQLGQDWDILCVVRLSMDDLRAGRYGLLLVQPRPPHA